MTPVLRWAAMGDISMFINIVRGKPRFLEVGEEGDYSIT